MAVLCCTPKCSGVQAKHSSRSRGPCRRKCQGSRGRGAFPRPGSTAFTQVRCPAAFRGRGLDSRRSQRPCPPSAHPPRASRRSPPRSGRRIRTLQPRHQPLLARRGGPEDERNRRPSGQNLRGQGRRRSSRHPLRGATRCRGSGRCSVPDGAGWSDQTRKGWSSGASSSRRSSVSSACVLPGQHRQGQVCVGGFALTRRSPATAASWKACPSDLPPPLRGCRRRQSAA